MYTVFFDDKVITNDESINTLGMVNLTIQNTGDVDIKFSKKVIPPNQEYGLNTSGLPLANETLALSFVGDGNKQAYISYGIIRKPSCHK